MLQNKIKFVMTVFSYKIKSKENIQTLLLKNQQTVINAVSSKVIHVDFPVVSTDQSLKFVAVEHISPMGRYYFRHTSLELSCLLSHLNI